MNQQQEPQITNQETALKILIQGINLAQSRGSFNLSEAGLLDKCIKMFTRKPDGVEDIPTPDTVINDNDDTVEVENIAI